MEKIIPVVIVASWANCMNSPGCIRVTVVAISAYHFTVYIMIVQLKDIVYFNNLFYYAYNYFYLLCHAAVLKIMPLNKFVLKSDCSTIEYI